MEYKRSLMLALGLILSLVFICSYISAIEIPATVCPDNATCIIQVPCSGAESVNYRSSAFICALNVSYDDYINNNTQAMLDTVNSFMSSHSFGMAGFYVNTTTGKGSIQGTDYGKSGIYMDYGDENNTYHIDSKFVIPILSSLDLTYDRIPDYIDHYYNNGSYDKRYVPSSYQNMFDNIIIHLGYGFPLINGGYCGTSPFFVDDYGNRMYGDGYVLPASADLYCDGDILKDNNHLAENITYQNNTFVPCSAFSGGGDIYYGEDVPLNESNNCGQGYPPCSIDNSWCDSSDINHDGSVSGGDLLTVFNNAYIRTDTNGIFMFRHKPTYSNQVNTENKLSSDGYAQLFNILIDPGIGSNTFPISLTGPQWRTDGVSNVLTKDIDYTLNGNTYKIINSNLTYAQTNQIYSYSWSESYGFHQTILKLLVGFICLAAFSFAVIFVNKMFKNINQ